MIGEKQEGSTAQRRRIEEFTLLVAEHRLDDCDDVVGRLRAEIPLVGTKIRDIPFAGQDNVFAQPGLSGEHRLDKGVDVALILRALIYGVVVRCCEQLLDFAVPGRCWLEFRPGLIQAGRRQAKLIAERLHRRAQIFDRRPVWAFGRVLRAGLVDHGADPLPPLFLPLFLCAGEFAFRLGQLLDCRLKYLVVGSDQFHVLSDHVLSGQVLTSRMPETLPGPAAPGPVRRI